MKPRFALICEDSRREDNGKLIFIGVYGSQILAHKIPAMLALTLVVSVEVSEPGEQKAAFQVLMNDEKLTGGAGTLKASTVGNHFFPIKQFLVHVPKEGDLIFQMKIDDKAWETVCVQPVALIRAST